MCYRSHCKSHCVAVSFAEPIQKALRIIPPDSERRRVAGVTSIDDKLYVIRNPSYKKIQVYDKETYEELDTSVEINGLSDDDNPWERGFTSCAQRKFLYVSDYHKDTVYVVDLSGETQNVKHWEVKAQKGSQFAGPSGLSVDGKDNVIVTCYLDSTIRIYEPNGKLSRFVQLPTKYIRTPYHAVEVTEGQLAVSHWEPEKGVTLIELVIGTSEYKVKQSSMDCKPKIDMYNPRYLAVNSNKSVFAVDQAKTAIIVLDFGSEGLYTNEKRTARIFPVSEEDNIGEPWCLHLDEDASRLYVGEWKYKRILVFDTASMTL